MSQPDKGSRIIDLAYPVRLSKIERELAGAAARNLDTSFSEYVRVLINRDLKQGDAHHEPASRL